MHIVSIGEVMAEISGTAPEFSISFAGDTFNTSVYLRRLMQPPAKVSYLTRLGEDPLSGACLDFAAKHGLSTEQCRTTPDANIGIYGIATDTAGERTFSYWRSSSAARGLFRRPEEFEGLENADLVYLSGITLAILDSDLRGTLLSRLQKLRRSGTRVAFDSNYRPALWESKEAAQTFISLAWQACDIALPSLDDETNLFGEATEAAVIDRLNGYGCFTGALKRGRIGPVDLGPSRAELAPANLAYVPRPVDTTAAGDSFNAGYLAAVLSRKPSGCGMSAGHALAAQVIAKRGAIVPTTDGVD